MKAARFHGKLDVRVEDVPCPKAGPNQCLVEVVWCGICGSDLHEYTAGPIGIPTPERPHVLTNGHLPVTLGHEFCGYIKTAPQDSGFREGQAVVVDPRMLCHSCYPCNRDKDNLCQKLGFLGYSGSDGGGGLSEFVAVDVDMLYAVPDNVSIDCAALVEPLAVAHHALKAPGIKLEGLDVLIIGGGPIGFALACALGAKNVKSITLSEPALNRRNQVKFLVDRVIDPRAEKVGDVCRQSTGGKGVEVVFDCAGVQVALENAIDSLVPGGTLAIVAIWEKPMMIQQFPVLLKEIKIVSSSCYNKEDYKEVVELMGQGKFTGYEKMITGRIPLANVVSEGFRGLLDDKDSHIKILVSPKMI